MNRRDVMELAAGKEMDVTVGVHVLDTHAHPDLYGNYSQTWDDMEFVVEHMTRLGWTFRLSTYSDGYQAWFEKYHHVEPGEDTPDDIYRANAETAPLAVCRAALLAVKGIPA